MSNKTWQIFYELWVDFPRTDEHMFEFYTVEMRELNGS